MQDSVAFVVCRRVNEAYYARRSEIEASMASTRHPGHPGHPGVRLDDCLTTGAEYLSIPKVWVPAEGLWYPARLPCSTC